MKSDQPSILDRAEMAVVRRDFLGGGGYGCYGDGMTTLALRLSPVSPSTPFFPPLFMSNARSSRLYIRRGLIS